MGIRSPQSAKTMPKKNGVSSMTLKKLLISGLRIAMFALTDRKVSEFRASISRNASEAILR